MQKLVNKAYKLLNNKKYDKAIKIYDSVLDNLSNDIKNTGKISKPNVHIPKIEKTDTIGVCIYGNPKGDNYKEKSITDKYFKNEVLVQKLLPGHPKTKLKSIIKDDFTFLDTAKILLSTKHVITIDTSIAHLCGLLGVKIYVVINNYFDWRWKHLKLYDTTEVIMLKDLKNIL